MPWLLSFYVCRILIRKGMTKLRQIMQIAWENKCIVILSFNGFSKVILNPWVSFRFLSCIFFNFSKRNTKFELLVKKCKMWVLRLWNMRSRVFQAGRYIIKRMFPLFTKISVEIVKEHLWIYTNSSVADR